MRTAVSLCLKVAVSALLLYFSFRLVDVTSVKERIARVDLGWLLLILPVLVLQTSLLAWRWQKIVAYCGAGLPFQMSFRFSIIALFFNQTLPSSIGGDAVRVWLLTQHASLRTS